MLYLAMHADLRDRYNNSEWLVYGKQAMEAPFTQDDVLVLGEWERSHLEAVQIAHRARQCGTRVVYVGRQANETDSFKKQLCMMGIYDFIFFGDDEIRLGPIDSLIENPRTPEDVREYMYQGEADEAPTSAPPVVDVFEVDDSSELALPAEEDEKGVTRIAQMFRKRRQSSGQIQPIMLSTGKDTIRKFVWPNPDPVNIRLIGDAGVGKSFLACQIATLCNQSELPAAVVENDISSLSEWVDIKDGVHAFTTSPTKGYRVIVDTRSPETVPIDDKSLVIVVSWPDKLRIDRCMLRLHELMISSERVLWVINHYSSGLVLPDELRSSAVCIPHEPRHFNATRMKIALAELDQDFAQLFDGVIARISETFIGVGRLSEREA